MTGTPADGAKGAEPRRVHAYRHVARFTLEAAGPLSVGTGQGAGLFDTGLVRDANGLPTVPGTALAGVLSGLYRTYFPSRGQDWRDLFGYEEERSRKSHSEKGQASRLEFSFGCIHGKDDRAREGLLFEAFDSDPLLELALRDAPVKRDHVKIDHRGAAEAQKKFDRVSLPPGFRFSFEAAMWGAVEEAEADKAKFLEVLGLMEADEFRLGGATRRGLGRLRLVKDNDDRPRLRYAGLDLSSAEGREAFVAYRRLAAIDDATDSFVQAAPSPLRPEAQARRSVRFQLKLRPCGFWRFGEGDKALLAPRDQNEEEKAGADSIPLTEARVVYRDGVGKALDEKGWRLVVPASAVKGPLAHRAEYYLNLWSDEPKFADKLSAEAFEAQCAVRGMDAVFGAAKTRRDGEGPGAAGLIIIDDAYVEFGDAGPAPVQIAHNTIDRFSGGVMNHRLFTEEVLYGGELTLDFVVLAGRPGKAPEGEEGGATPVERRHWKALDAALADLCEGRLALGADGHGYCELSGTGAPCLSAEFGGADDR